MAPWTAWYGEASPSQALLVSLAHDSPDDFARAIGGGEMLQQHLAELGLVAVGGMAASLHAGHRFSTDVDHVSSILTDDFTASATRIRDVPGWRTTRTEGRALILGEYEGIRMGVRQLRRRVPVESVVVRGLRVSTAVETLRIKAHLLAIRRRLFDFVDIAALVDLLGPEQSVEALASLTQLYHAPSDGAATPIARFHRAAHGLPADHPPLALATYRGIADPYSNWRYVSQVVRGVADRVFQMEQRGRTPSASADGGVYPAPAGGAGRR